MRNENVRRGKDKSPLRVNDGVLELSLLTGLAMACLPIWVDWPGTASSRSVESNIRMYRNEQAE